MKNKKMIGTWLVATFALMLVSVGITYAFFSYIKIGGENVIKLGDIYFNSDYSNVTLSNVFPINKSKIDTDTENTMTVNVNITGYTTYEQGVDYKIMAEDVNVTLNDKKIPVSVKVTSENIPNIQTYNFEDEMIVVENSVFAQGNIMPSDGNVDGTLTLTAYIDKANVVISDTYDGTESDEMGTTNDFVKGRDVFTTSEWNNLDSNGGISFKVKVVAWEHEETLHDVMLANAVMDNEASDFVSSSTGIDFSLPSSDTNGKGLYKLSSTVNDTYPIVYYRGAVENNNVVFGDFCWKAVRTTETGGVKLIYNGDGSTYERIPLSEGAYSIINNPAGFTFDESNNSWNITWTTNNNTSGSAPIEFSFNVPEDSGYVMNVIVTSPSNGNGTINYYVDGSYVTQTQCNTGETFEDNVLFSALTNVNLVSLKIYSSPDVTFKIKMTKRGDFVGYDCSNSSFDQSLVAGYNDNYTSPSLSANGYMYGDFKYDMQPDNYITHLGAYGDSFKYENDSYKLLNITSSFDTSHRYYCADTTGSCKEIYYMFNDGYIVLTDGKDIEDVFNETLYINKIDSSVKMVLDNWYVKNMIKYSELLEDEVWCNDRSVPMTGDYSFTNSGWNHNNGQSMNFYFNSYDRVYNTNKPSLKCSMKTDKFSLSNRNATLKYPVALLTSDELMLGGITENSSSISYLNSNVPTFWTMSPAYFKSEHYTLLPSWFYLSSDGRLVESNGYYTYLPVLPSISLGLGTSIEDGDGTATNPYVIGGY